MPKSMTGFARVDHSTTWGNVVCELKSVNHRFLDLSFRTPDSLRAIENRLREMIRQSLARGKVDCSISIRFANNTTSRMELDKDVANAYLRAVNELNGLLGTQNPINPLELLNMPGVLSAPDQDSESLHQAVTEALKECLVLLGQSRQHEGDVLGAEILQRTAKIRELTAGLVEIVPAIRALYEEKIRQRFADTAIEINPERLEQELIFLAQKMDVEEEIDRLNAHLNQIDELIRSNEPVGRKLDFLMQELNREANTLGSKSQGLSQTNTSVDMKVLIEQIREQIQNIE